MLNCGTNGTASRSPEASRARAHQVVQLKLSAASVARTIALARVTPDGRRRPRFDLQRAPRIVYGQHVPAVQYRGGVRAGEGRLNGHPTKAGVDHSLVDDWLKRYHVGERSLDLLREEASIETARYIAALEREVG
jgi:hypothetical protein